MATFNWDQLRSSSSFKFYASAVTMITSATTAGLNQWIEVDFGAGGSVEDRMSLHITRRSDGVYEISTGARTLGELETQLDVLDRIQLWIEERWGED